MNGAAQAGVVASARAALPTAGAIFFVDVADAVYTPTASLPAGEQSPGTLGRVDSFPLQYGIGGPFLPVGSSSRPYLHGTGGGTGAPLEYGVRAGTVGGAVNAPRRTCPDPSVWNDTSYSFFLRCRAANSGALMSGVSGSGGGELGIASNTGSTLRHRRSAASPEGGNYTYTSSAAAFTSGVRVSLGLSYARPSNTTTLYVNGVAVAGAAIGGSNNHVYTAADLEVIWTLTAAVNLYISISAAFSGAMSAADHASLHSHAAGKYPS